MLSHTGAPSTSLSKAVTGAIHLSLACENKEGMESEVQIHAMDLFPTLSEIIEAKLPQDRVFDGESLLPLFEDKPLARNTHQPFFYYNCENLQAVRKGPWKLHLPRKRSSSRFGTKTRCLWARRKPFYMT